MEHAHAPRGAYLKNPARRCSGALLLLAIASFLIACGGASSDSPADSTPGAATLTWDAVTASNLGGYKVYYGTASGTYTQSVPVGDVTTYTLGGLNGNATYYMAVAAFDTSNHESPFSNEVSKAIP